MTSFLEFISFWPYLIKSYKHILSLIILVLQTSPDMYEISDIFDFKRALCGQDCMAARTPVFLFYNLNYIIKNTSPEPGDKL